MGLALSETKPRISRLVARKELHNLMQNVLLLIVAGIYIFECKEIGGLTKSCRIMLRFVGLLKVILTHQNFLL